MLLLAVAGIALIPAVVAQSSRRAPAPTPYESAARALLDGRYDEVATLTARLDALDPEASALRARALIARGQYQPAEAALRPAAERAPTSEAALELGLLLDRFGREEAEGMLVRVARQAEVATAGRELARAARALRALNRTNEANAAYRDAVATAPRDAAIHTAWGDLFREKYNNAEALKSYQAALREDERHGPAFIGIARALANDNPPQAMAMASKALEINPSDVDAHLFVADSLIDNGKRPEARDTLRKALAVNPTSLEAHAYLGALAYIEDKRPEFEAEVRNVLAVAPKFGEVYRIAGDLAARNYRFDEAVVLVRRAIDLDPTNSRALGDLGTHLLRTGDEPAARVALEAAFKLDAFEVVTFNLLQMMDSLDKFVTVKEGDIVIKMHPDEAPVLREYALALSREALATLSRRYEFTPKGPILIEIFPKHDDFAVRNVGLPGMIGALGACFGRVVTLDSPRARPPGDFQWEATLWHELAHVITLQMSDQRVPRWLTEGISEYEEKIARPYWGRGMDLEYAQLLERGETLKLRDLNSAFTNPQTISLAYYQASLLVDHIVKTFGEGALQKLVRSFATGLETEAALKLTLSTDFDALQVSFDRQIDQQFGDLRRALAGPPMEKLRAMTLPQLQAAASEHPRSYPVQLALGRALRKDGRTDDAMRAYETAAALAPMARGPESPHVQMADISIERKDPVRAIASLQAVIAADFDNIGAARHLVQLLREQKANAARLQPIYERIAAIDPFDAEAHGALGRFALDRNDVDSAVREFNTVLALGPVDAAGAHTDLAESYLKGGRKAEARKQTLAALEIAPSYEHAQDLLLRIAGDKR